MKSAQVKIGSPWLRSVYGDKPGVARSDGELIERFAAGPTDESEAAFGELVERHGPMVFGVCRRMLADRHEAEDAFQATFLVLARKAARLRSASCWGTGCTGWRSRLPPGLGPVPRDAVAMNTRRRR